MFQKLRKEFAIHCKHAFGTLKYISEGKWRDKNICRFKNAEH